MLEPQLAAIYEALWSLDAGIEAPCRCVYRPRAWFDRRGRAAECTAEFSLYFDNAPDEIRPRIWIARDPLPSLGAKADVAGASVDELVALSHERGHERSFRRGTYVPTWGAAPDVALAEEHRAWDHARSLLLELGFETWDAFDVYRKRALASYEALVSSPR